MTSDTATVSTAVPKLGHELLERGDFRLVDLTREIFEGMPLWPGHQLPFTMVNQTHEGFKERWSTNFGFEAHNWLMSEHTGTHTDAIFEYDPNGAPLDGMPLEYYYGDAVALDLSNVRHPNHITPEALQEANSQAARSLKKGDTALLYTGHGDRTYPSREFVTTYTGLNREAAVWLAEQGVVNIGIDSLAIDHSDDQEFSAHAVCAEYQIVNTENLTNLDQLLAKECVFIGLPLRFRNGTGSPIRAVAWIK